MELLSELCSQAGLVIGTLQSEAKKSAPDLVSEQYQSPGWSSVGVSPMAVVLSK